MKFIRLLCVIIALVTGMQAEMQQVHAEYGDVIMENHKPQTGYTPVVFSHAKHRPHFRCNVCHGELDFVMQAGDNRIDMKAIDKGLFCGACHNGKLAWSAKDCKRCHASQAPQTEGKSKKTKGSNTNWVELLHNGQIKPRANLDGSVEYVRYDRDIVIPAKGTSLNDVLFSHAIHTEWLSCANCHPTIFDTKKGGNPMTMVEIARGKWCGACHRNVAFPITDCNRCHTIKKDN